MILITGATGQLGRAIVQQLVTRIPADQIGVSVRDCAGINNIQKNRNKKIVFIGMNLSRP